VAETRIQPVNSIYDPNGIARVAVEVFGDEVLRDGEMVFEGDIVNLRWLNSHPNTDAIFRATFRTSGQTQSLTLTANTPEWQVVAVPAQFNARAERFATTLDWVDRPSAGEEGTGGGTQPGKKPR
jgi:hypothetical protein